MLSIAPWLNVFMLGLMLKHGFGNRDHYCVPPALGSFPRCRLFTSSFKRIRRERTNLYRFPAAQSPEPEDWCLVGVCQIWVMRVMLLYIRNVCAYPSLFYLGVCGTASLGARPHKSPLGSDLHPPYSSLDFLVRDFAQQSWCANLCPQESSKLEFIHPTDHFMETADYRNKFGDPSSRGHSVIELDGLEGVLIPGERLYAIKFSKVFSTELAVSTLVSASSGAPAVVRRRQHPDRHPDQRAGGTSFFEQQCTHPRARAGGRNVIYGIG
jgi:hypothetical protein